MGEKVGTTPLGISQTTVFPPTFPSEKQALYGVVTVRKAGCKDSIQRVSGDALDNGLQVRLECGDIEREAATAKVGANVVESRLRRVQDLREKGLITEQEARNLRQRILDEL